ncbi:MAG: hypothetical protein MI700_03505, partial [Balneolales bacterium]|nr:hypothetical protein [Balneolales bacterium]
LSLNLKKSDSIKNKIYRWDGIIKELSTSNEELYIYFMVTLPKKKQLQELVKLKLKSTNYDHIRSKLVFQEEAETFTKKIKEELQLN